MKFGHPELNYECPITLNTFSKDKNEKISNFNNGVLDSQVLGSLVLKKFNHWKLLPNRKHSSLEYHKI